MKVIVENKNEKSLNKLLEQSLKKIFELAFFYYYYY